MERAIVSRLDILTMQGVEAVAQFRQTTQAGLVKSFLDSHGIQCVLYDSALNAVWGGVLEESRVKIFINDNQAEEVRKLLREGGFGEFLT